MFHYVTSSCLWNRAVKREELHTLNPHYNPLVNARMLYVYVMPSILSFFFLSLDSLNATMPMRFGCYCYEEEARSQSRV